MVMQIKLGDVVLVMTRRPGRIKKEIFPEKEGIGRPGLNRLKMAYTEEFLKIKKFVWDLIKEEVV